MEIGPQYNLDDSFKKLARKYQSLYRAKVLKVDYNEYGNRLNEFDAKENLLNYYPGLNVKTELRKRYPKYSKPRDANMLRSEHMPFNLFAPLKLDLNLAIDFFSQILKLKIVKITMFEFEYAPKPAEEFLDDRTSFDIYIEFLNESNERCGLGIEVKYTEGAYSLKDSERKKINDPKSTYYKTTDDCNMYIPKYVPSLKDDGYRQIWRNHILGESMVAKGVVSHFYSATFHPVENKHFSTVLPEYKKFLKKAYRNRLMSITFTDYINFLERKAQSLSDDYTDWIEYLIGRYLY